MEKKNNEEKKNNYWTGWNPKTRVLNTGQDAGQKEPPFPNNGMSNGTDTLQRMVWEFLTELEMVLPYKTTTTSVVFIQFVWKLRSHKNPKACMQMFVRILFIITQAESK